VTRSATRHREIEAAELVLSLPQCAAFGAGAADIFAENALKRARAEA